MTQHYFSIELNPEMLNKQVLHEETIFISCNTNTLTDIIFFCLFWEQIQTYSKCHQNGVKVLSISSNSDVIMQLGTKWLTHPWVDKHCDHNTREYFWKKYWMITSEFLDNFISTQPCLCIDYTLALFLLMAKHRLVNYFLFRSMRTLFIAAFISQTIVNDQMNSLNIFSVSRKF